jgi:hypothetical protein
VGGNAAILLEHVEELLDQVTGPVQVLVIFARLFAAALGRNHETLARFLQGNDGPFLSIVSPVGDDGGGGRTRQ